MSKSANGMIKPVETGLHMAHVICSLFVRKCITRNYEMVRKKIWEAENGDG